MTALIREAIRGLVNLVVPLRLSADEETEGLDLVLHEEHGYDI